MADKDEIIQKLNANLSRLQADNDALVSELVKNSAALNKLAEPARQIQTLHTTIAALEASLLAAQTENNELKSAQETHERSMKIARDENALLRDKLAAAKAAQSALAAERDAAKTAAEAAAKAAQSVLDAERNAAKAAAEAAAEAAQKAFAVERDELQLRLEQAMKRVDELEATLRLTTTARGVDSLTKIHNDRVAELNAKIASAETRVQELEQSNAAQQAALDNATTQAQAMESRAKELQANMAQAQKTFTERVAIVETRLQPVVEAIEGLGVRVERREQAMKAFAEQLANIVLPPHEGDALG